MAKARKVCKDCKSPRRPANYPGPRCYTCHKAVTSQRKATSWERRLWDTYRLTPAQYNAIYDAQGGVCAICRRATGRTKRLAVDHDHSCCPGPTSCGECVRSLCCSQCNRMLGHARDDTEMFERAINYLMRPPGREVLREWNVR